MGAQHIVHAIRGAQDLEEAAGVCKNIDKVTEQQADLVKINIRLFPIAVIKGKEETLFYDLDFCPGMIIHRIT